MTNLTAENIANINIIISRDLDLLKALTRRAASLINDESYLDSRDLEEYKKANERVAAGYHLKSLLAGYNRTQNEKVFLKRLETALFQAILAKQAYQAEVFMEVTMFLQNKLPAHQ